MFYLQDVLVKLIYILIQLENWIQHCLFVILMYGFETILTLITAM